MIPGDAARGGRDHARGDGGRCVRPPGDLGSRHVAPTAARGRRERGRCCRASCQLRPITFQSSPRRWCRTSTRAPARRSSTRTFGAGGHAALLAQRLRGDGTPDRDRPRPDRRAVLRALPPRARREGATAPRRVLGRAAASRVERRAGGRRPARPRRLLDADRPARARLLVRGRRAARHAHGPGRRHVGRATSSTTWASVSSRTSSSGTGKSGTRGRSRARSRGVAASSGSSGPAISST